MKYLDKKINPFKKIAEFHNKGLDYLIEQLSKSPNDISNDRIVEILSQFFNQEVGDGSSKTEALYYAMLAKAQNDVVNLELSVDSLKKAGVGKQAIERIKSILELKGNDITVLLNQIEKIEQKVLNEDTEGKDKDIVLCSLAIATASIMYWDGEFKKKESKWKKIFGAIKNLPWKEDVKGGADALADKAIEAGVAVIFAEPVTGTAIVITYVAGKAIFASAKEWFKQSKDHKNKGKETTSAAGSNQTTQPNDKSTQPVRPKASAKPNAANPEGNLTNDEKQAAKAKADQDYLKTLERPSPLKKKE